MVMVLGTLTHDIRHPDRTDTTRDNHLGGGLMNQLSPYADRIAWTRSLASLLIGIALTAAILVPAGRGAVSTVEAAVAERDATIKALDLSALTAKATERQLRSIIATMHEEYKLLATFLDAGITAETPEEIRLLLEQAEDMPFGSPFSGPTRVTADYGVYSIDIFGWSGVEHEGIDLVPRNGDWAVYLPAESALIDFGWSDIFGNYMEFETSSGYRMFFAHLERVLWHDLDGDGNWSLDIGDILPARSRIAIAGQTGAYATGRHLHYEIKKEVDSVWKTLDPQAIIGYTGAVSDDNE